QELVKSQEEVQKTNEMLQHQKDSLDLLKREQDVKDLEIKNEKLKNDQQKQASQLLLAILGLVSVVLLGVGLLYRTNRKKNIELGEKNKV
ncbi:LPXTG cell wall anchor domain-containing protein, partial [Salmonella enterica]|uniref:LPXTG cell wall anchor domain-containing protein n=1 Tax=Salmonella enterica TaxID=28901 RepID=UPI003D2CB4F6